MEKGQTIDNQTLRNIKTRRSIRSYQSLQIHTDDLELILEAALYAPSGSNHQLNRFTAIQNAEILNELNEVVRKAFSGLKHNNDDNYLKAAAKKRAENPNYNFYYHAPTLIIASNESGYPNAMADCAVGLQNIFLAAHSLGLGSCWINQLRWLDDHQDIRNYLQELGIPKEHIICGAAAIGYAKGMIPDAAPRKYNAIRIIT